MKKSQFLPLVCLASILNPAIAEEERVAVQKPGFLDRQIEKIPHEQLDLPWLTGDFNIWGGVASAAVVGIATDRASDDSPIGGLGGRNGETGPVVEFGERLSTLSLSTAYLTALSARDYRGVAYMGIHNIVSSGLVKALKRQVGQRRPGDQDDRSFPSGHTNTAFLAAAFMQQRYGARWGIPSYISAFLVGWSRIYGNKHYVNDIIGGASIGMMSAWAIVPPYDAERLARWRDLERERKFRYEWEMTLNDVDRNQVQAPMGTGDTFRSPLDTDTDEPWANSHAAFEYRLDEHRSIHGRFSPWELRSFGQFSSPTSFAGTTFPADEDLRVAHLMWTYGAQYRQSLLHGERLTARWGLGVSGQYTEQEIFVVDESQPEGRGLSAKSDAHAWYGVFHVDADLKLFWKLFFGAEAELGLASDNSYLDWSARLKARLNAKWELSLGWREFETDLKDDALRNDFKRSGLALNLGYAF
jgi:membrane-associated phospholipid phosphatase